MITATQPSQPSWRAFALEEVIAIAALIALAAWGLLMLSGHGDEARGMTV